MQTTQSLLSMANLLTSRIELKNRLTKVVAHLGQHRIGNFSSERLPSSPIRAKIVVLNAQSQLEQTHWVQIKHLDRNGITFTHRQPLYDRRVVVSYEDPTFGPFVAEIDLSWCRFRCRGEYRSGGRFVQLANLSA